jgi:hypothetical protein
MPTSIFPDVIVVKSREEAIWKYEQWFVEQVKDEEFKKKVLALEGKRLGCYCKPLACHGDVIVRWLYQYRYEKDGCRFLDGTVPCPECGRSGFGFSRRVGEVCRACQFKHSGKTIYQYYMELADKAEMDSWREYFTAMANWDKGDGFTMSSGDWWSPIPAEFQEASGLSVSPSDVAKKNKLAFHDGRLLYCKKTDSYYITQGFTGGCAYNKVEL